MGQGSRAAALTPALCEGFAHRVEAGLAELPSPGLNMAVAVDNQVVWTHAAGLAQFGPDVPLTPRHLHRIGSITKLFTAHAVLRLRDEGRLHLDDEVSRWVPEFRPPGPDRVTLRHILCHGSGISNEGGRDVWGSGNFPAVAEFRRWIAEFVPVAPPMTYLKYSNAAYSMLGLVIQAASGLPYERYLHQAVLAPLGMADTMFDLDAEAQRRFAHGHAMPPDQQRFERTVHQDLRAFNACGMLASTAADTVKLAMWHWADDPRLPATTTEEMHRLHLIDTGLPGWQGGYGLGWRLDRQGDRISAGHGGSYLGNRCQLQMSLPDRVAVAVFANRGQALGADTLARELLWATVEALGQVPPSRVRPNADALPEGVAGLLGRYAKHHWYDMTIVWAVDGPRLRMGRDPGPGARLEQVGPDHYRLADGRYVREDLLVLRRDAAGRAEVISMAGGELRRF